jgi:hypothetical protein
VDKTAYLGKKGRKNEWMIDWMNKLIYRCMNE